jgi:DNA-3-methyladenine glycosylase
VLDVARDLLGKVLCSAVDGRVTKAVIVETEAYAGVGDRASHAYGGRRTRRTEPMYAPGGLAYVYLCYGIHHMLNFVCEPEGSAAAVLVRGGEVVEGAAIVRRRRGGRLDCDGPGKVAQALALDRSFSGAPLDGNLRVTEGQPVASWASTPRIGIDYANVEDRVRPWRFVAPRSGFLVGSP